MLPFTEEENEKEPDGILPPDRPVFLSEEIYAFTKVKPYVLRFWQSEFSHLQPRRDESGRLVYTREDVETIREIRRLLYEEGMTLAGARKQLARKRKVAAEPVRGGAPETGTKRDGRDSGISFEDLLPASSAAEASSASPKPASRSDSTRGRQRRKTTRPAAAPVQRSAPVRVAEGETEAKKRTDRRETEAGSTPKPQAESGARDAKTDAPAQPPLVEDNQMQGMRRVSEEKLDRIRKGLQDILTLLEKGDR